MSNQIEDTKKCRAEENGEECFDCPECDAHFERQRALFLPLWRGERQAGLLEPDPPQKDYRHALEAYADAWDARHEGEEE